MDKSTEKDKILAKLRKLMNLKENAAAIGNEGEAAAAAAGISRLLYMYNLTEADIPEQERIDNPIVSEDIPFKPEVQGGQWYELLVNCVCEFNLCTALVTSTYKKSRYTKDKFNIVGRQKNVEIVLYLISFLANKFYQIGKRDYPQYKHDCLFIKGIIPKTEYMYLKSYLYGCVLGLISKLRQEREEMQNECDVKSLVLSTRSEIDEFLKNKDIRKGKFRKPELDNESARKGFVTGLNVEINKGIYSKTVSKERRIEK